ncbi:hypothetical protein CFAM422_003316 [Trichoderma lentiforme]|uniref:Uncharacterized protein n=1 Tax=Trichoderma lentiforme TaxID=1567552 RepID=A0A9P4XKJ2_9HYPO|nr:hypothetical protein CFAM422_003316 [Trichoderma lentiforme]
MVVETVSDQPRVGSSSGGILGADQTRRYSIPMNGQRCISQSQKKESRKRIMSLSDESFLTLGLRAANAIESGETAPSLRIVP